MNTTVQYQVTTSRALVAIFPDQDSAEKWKEEKNSIYAQSLKVVRVTTYTQSEVIS